MRVLVIVVAALATLGLAAFGVLATQNVSRRVGPVAHETSAGPLRVASSEAPATAAAVPSQASGPPSAPALSPPPATTAAPSSTPAGADAAGAGVPKASPASAAAASPIPACDKPGGIGLSRIVEIDTTGGPAFGSEHFKRYDFLRPHEVLLTFDDGPWPDNTEAVIKALTDNCLKATFFEIGQYAARHPELARMVAEAGMTIGSHTYSNKDLAKTPYADDLDQAKREIEMGVSAVRAAAGAPIAPFFRFPDLRQPPTLLAYLGERNIATFSTDIDSLDFWMRRPEQVVESVMNKLKKAGKGIVLMHDLKRTTAAAMPELLRRLKAEGYRIVHMVARAPVTTLSAYDEMIGQQDASEMTNTRPQSSVVRTIGGD